MKQDRKDEVDDMTNQMDNLAPFADGDQKLNRHIGFFSGTVMNVGEIVGSGIFTNPSFILQNTGSGGLMLVLWVVGALTSVCGLLTFLELGTMLPRSGGEKTYISYIYPNPKQLLSFLFMILAGVFTRCGSLAQGSIVFGDNMVYAIYVGKKRNEWASRGFGVFCITFWVIVNILSAKNSIKFNNLFTTLKVTLLVLLICVGFVGFAGTVQNAGSYATALYFVIYSYSGYYNLQRVTDELINPLVNLPRCGATSIGIVATLYLLANCAYLAVLPVEIIKSSNLTVASNLFSRAFGGVFGSCVLPIFVGLSSFGTVGVVLYSTSRVMLEFAREGHLPFGRFFSVVHPVLETPLRAILLIYVLALVFLLGPPAGTVFEFIMAFNNYGEYFFAALCAVGIFIIRRREPDLARPIRAPSVLIILFIAVCLFTIVFVFVPPMHSPVAYPYYVPYVCWIGFAFLCIIPWYVKMVMHKGLENSYNSDIRKQGQELYNDDFKH